MDAPRVVITGVNAISGLGCGFEQLREGLSTYPAPVPVRSFEYHELDYDCPCIRIADFDPVEVLGKKGLRTKDWSTKVLMGTIEQGFKETLAGFPSEERPGLCVGTAFGSVQSIGDFLSDSIVNGVNAVNPMAFANTVINSPTGNANIRFGMQALSSTVSTGFNASLDALVYSHDFLQRGHARSVLAGGLEEISYYALVGLGRSGVLSKSGTMHPFAIDADGYVAGEGCAMMMLETEESARTRGAAVMGELAGVGTTFDCSPAAGGYNPEGEGATASIRAACESAGISVSDIGLVVASASGDPRGDAMEARVIREVLNGTPVVAYKGATGECYGASSALSVACLLSDMRSKRISGPAETYATLDGVNVAAKGTSLTAENVLVNSFSCDGNCGSIIVRAVT